MLYESRWRLCLQKVVLSMKSSSLQTGAKIVEFHPHEPFKVSLKAHSLLYGDPKCSKLDIDNNISSCHIITILVWQTGQVVLCSFSQSHIWQPWLKHKDVVTYVTSMTCICMYSYDYLFHNVFMYLFDSEHFGSPYLASCLFSTSNPVFLSPSSSRSFLWLLLFLTADCWKLPPAVTMSACGRKALTLLSSVFAISGLGLLGVAVSTDYWLYLEEGVVMPLNQSIDIKTSLHSGLWRVCFLAGE